MSDGKSKFKSLLGIISLVLFLVLIGTFIPVNLDIHNKFSEPQYKGESGWGLAIKFWFLMICVWAPLMMASFTTGLTAIVINKGRVQGIIAVSGVIVFAVWGRVTNTF